MPLDDKVRKALDTIFSGDAGLYQTRGWNQRSGFGTRPALLNIDLANAWTRPGYRFSCDDMDERIIPGVQRLLAAARAKKVPRIIYTTTAFCSRFDMGRLPASRSPSRTVIVRECVGDRCLPHRVEPVRPRHEDCDVEPRAALRKASTR